MLSNSRGQTFFSGLSPASDADLLGRAMNYSGTLQVVSKQGTDLKKRRSVPVGGSLRVN